MSDSAKERVFVPPVATDEYLVDAYSHLIAEQMSGHKAAIPEQIDLDIAYKVFEFVEAEIQKYANGANRL